MKRAWEPRGGCVERFFLLRNQDALASLFADPCQDKSRGKQGHHRRREGKEEARRRQGPELSLFWAIPVKKRGISGENNTPHLGVTSLVETGEGMPAPTLSPACHSNTVHGTDCTACHSTCCVTQPPLTTRSLSGSAIKD